MPVSWMDVKLTWEAYTVWIIQTFVTRGLGKADRHYHNTSWLVTKSMWEGPPDVNLVPQNVCLKWCHMHAQLTERSWHPNFVDRLFYFGRIWNNYVDIQWKSMPVRFILFLCIRGYNFLGNLTRKYKVWRKNTSKYKLIQNHQPLVIIVHACIPAQSADLFGFCLTIYIYKLRKAFPPKYLLRIHQPSGLFSFIWAVVWIQPLMIKVF